MIRSCTFLTFPPRRYAFIVFLLAVITAGTVRAQEVSVSAGAGVDDPAKPPGKDGEAPAAVASPPQEPSKEPEENLLADDAVRARPADSRAVMNDEDAQADSENSFGSELMKLNLETTWSGYGDVVARFNPDKPFTFEATHFNPIVTARMGDSLGAELELEIEGPEIAAEYAFLDVKIPGKMTLRLGKFLVPLGRFNEVLHASFRWPMVTRPLVFRTVLPAVWPDIGAQLRGRVRFSSGGALDYAVAVINGLGGSAALPGSLPPEASPGPAKAAEFGRSLRFNYKDNNSDKAVGGRLGFSINPGSVFGATTLGMSAYTGDVDSAGAVRLTILDVDFNLKLGPVNLSGEAVQSMIGTPTNPIAPFEQGFYLAAGYDLMPVSLHLRWDHATTKATDGRTMVRKAAVASVRYTFSVFWSVRAEVNLPTETLKPSVLSMAAFSF